MTTDSLPVRFRRRLDSRPDGRALAFLDGQGRFEWHSFGECHERAARCAAVFSDTGLGAGDVCVLVLPSDEFCTSALLGALQLGAIPLLAAPPIVRGLHSNRLEIIGHVVDTTRAKLVVGGDDLASAAGELERAHRETRFLFGPESVRDGDPRRLPEVRPASRDWALFQLTSGTTGFPRICTWRQERVLAALDGMRGAMALRPDDVCLNWTPLYHDMGLVNNFLLCMVTGIPLALLGALEFVKRPALWLRGLADTEATTTWSPNFGFALAAQRVRDDELDGVRLDGMRAFWNAAERIHHETVLAFHERFAGIGVTRSMLKTNFGCAENIGGATFSDPGPEGTYVVERVDGRALYEQGEARPIGDDDPGGVGIVGCGRAVPGMKIHIAETDGGRAADGRVGEVVLDTPSRMSGYLGDEDETRQALQADGLHTGDLGYLRDGEFFWVGRGRERINLYGQKLDPSDFERILLNVVGLREGSFAAFGVDDPSLGTQRLVLVVEVRRRSERSLAEVERDVREQVLRQMGITVGDVVLVAEGTITKTSSGKRRHRFYRELYLRGGLRPLPRE